MNSSDDQKPIIEESPQASSPPIDPDQEEKYKKLLEEYTNQVKPDDQTSSQLENQIPQDISTQSFSSQIPLNSQPTEQSPTPDEYASPTYQQTISPNQVQSSDQSQISHQLPPQFEDPSPQTSTTNQDDASTPVKKSSFFKYLFYITTLVFVVIIALLVKDYIKLQQLIQSPAIQDQTQTEQSQPSTSQDLTVLKCFINDTYLAIGQSFPAEDACNTCQCQLIDGQPQVICSTNDCLNDDIESDNQQTDQELDTQNQTTEENQDNPE